MATAIEVWRAALEDDSHGPRKCGVLRLVDGRIRVEPDQAANQLDRKMLHSILQHDAFPARVWAHEDPQAFLDALPMSYSGYTLWCEREQTGGA